MQKSRKTTAGKASGSAVTAGAAPAQAVASTAKETRAFAFDAHGTEFAVRAVLIDGEPWFVAADVCAALSIARTDDGVSRLDDDEKGAASIRTPGGAQQMTIINESGLYSLIMSSRKPQAKPFKRWVTGTVLPDIRKTGSHLPAGKVAIDLSEYERLLTIKATRGLVSLSHETERVESASKAIASDHARGLSKRKPQKKANKALQDSVAAALQVEMFDGKDAPSAEQIQREADAVAAANSCPEIRVVAEVATTAINAIQAMAADAMSVRRLH